MWIMFRDRRRCPDRASFAAIASRHKCPAASHQPTPAAKWRREEPLVELVRIPGEVFRRLLEESPALRDKVQATVARRRAHTARLQSVPQGNDTAELTT